MHIRPHRQLPSPILVTPKERNHLLEVPISLSGLREICMNPYGQGVVFRCLRLSERSPAEHDSVYPYRYFYKSAAAVQANLDSFYIGFVVWLHFAAVGATAG